MSVCKKYTPYDSVVSIEVDGVNIVSLNVYSRRTTGFANVGVHSTHLNTVAVPLSFFSGIYEGGGRHHTNNELDETLSLRKVDEENWVMVQTWGWEDVSTLISDEDVKLISEMF